ncbi:hydantoinase B/oxoprolinase family protein [Bosea sp. RAC05]|uniref:hydantoinase B/oxoprolinase family protein n=1 Tax=Bosea sp. RAC05 TaxID=1842539 RepID=UPI00083D042A|nr:hydantoinase B/oxoprolinase family protein [Bosea sp. RAC05]AOG08062.1 hydantoinase B/oxoprolinase family protein [Bosea sp. RAC05]
MSRRFDPITLDVIQNALGSIADELALVIMRSAYSNIVRDAMDYSTAVCDHEGRTVAQGLTTPVHLGSFPDAMRALVSQFAGRMSDGDIFIFNDPYGAGGMHLPDFYIVKPVFVGSCVEGYIATLAHQCDIGGLAPGGMAVFATEIYQEGLRIPILKLHDAGVANEAIPQIVAKNSRQPVEVLGDIRAQIAACGNGEKGLRQLIERYGVDEFRRYTAELHDYAERLIRAEISALPDGTYEFEDFLDGLGENPEPIRFKCALIIAGDHITVDWEGTSPQVKAAINGPIPTTHAMAYLAVRCAIGVAIPNCEGYMRAITVKAPKGSIVNPNEPAACGARGVICFRMYDAMLGAFSQILPNRIPAANEGGSSAPHIAGRTRDNRPFLISGGLMGCWGGSAVRDGQEGISNPAANLGNAPIELVESRLPVEITCYSFVQNSGGPGRHRGGVALMRGYRLLEEEAELVMRSDRRAVLPYGLFGGEPGTPSWNFINPGPDQVVLPVCPFASVPMKQDDIFLHIQAGAGGYGDPLERAPAKVLLDLLNELITTDYASDVYGVVIVDGAVDEVATGERRRALASGGAIAKASYLDHFARSTCTEGLARKPNASPT